MAVRDDVAKHIKIINTDGKYVLWFKLEKRLLNSKWDVSCGIVHIPLEGSKYVTTDCFLEFEEELISITNESQCISFVGDFNARVGHLKIIFSMMSVLHI